MAHIDNQMQQYETQLNELKTKLAQLEEEKKQYVHYETERKTKPETNLEIMTNWLILMEPLKEYYNLVEKLNEKKIEVVNNINPKVSSTHDKLNFFGQIPQWQNKYPEITNLERELHFVRQNLPPYIYDSQSVGFISHVRYGNKVLNIPSKFMVDFVDGTHNMCKLFSENMKSVSSELQSIKKDLAELKRI